MAGNAGQIRAGGAYVEVGADASRLEKELDKAASKFRNFSSVTNQIGRDFTKVGVSLTSPFILATKIYESTGESLFRASQRTGIAVESLSRLGHAAMQSGVDMDALENGIKKMQRTLGNAALGSVEAQRALAQIGLTISDLQGKSPDVQFAAIAAAMENVTDPTTRAADALAIFGKNGTQLLPLLDQGTDGIAQLTKRTDALGITLDTAAVTGAAHLHSRITDLTAVLKNSFFRAGEAVATLMQKFVETATRGAIALNRWISGHAELAKKVLLVGGVVAAAGFAFLGLSIAASVAAKSLSLISVGFTAIRTVAASGVTLLTTAVSGLIAVLGFVLTPVGTVAAGMVALGAYFLYATDAGKRTLSRLGSYFTDLKTVAMSTFGGIRDALAAGDFKLAAQVAWAGVKLAFAEGIAPLKTMWNDITLFLKSAWLETWKTVTDAVFRAMKVINDAFAYHKRFTDFVGHTIGGTLAEDRELSRHNAVAVRLKTQVGNGEITQAEADRQAAKEEEYFKSRMEAIKGSVAGEEKTSVAELAKSLADNQSNLDALLAQAQSDHDQAEKNNSKDYGDAIAQAKASLEKSKAELAAAIARANKEGGGKGLLSSLFGALPPLPPLPPNPKFPADYDATGVINQVKASGTFSAAGAFGLAGGDVQKQHLSVAKKQQTLLEFLLEATRKTGEAIETASRLA